MKTLSYVASLVLFASALPLTSLHSAQYDQRLGNLSTRAQVGTGGNVMITGFVVQEGAPKRVLLRAVGARLATAPFNLSGVLADPQLQLYNSQGALVLANDNWSATDLATMNSVGAFTLTNGSRDAALVATLSPGTYTAQVSGVGNTSGVAILEVYDVTGSARLMNLSTRAFVGTGNATFFSGLSVAPGGGARRVLVRAAGPSLGALGVAGALADPSVAILDSAGRQIANGANNDWESGGAAALRTAFAQAGAFPFPAGSRDAALLIDLAPGNYTIQVNGVGGTTGTALVELYDLSPDSLATVSVSATVPATDTVGGTPAVFTFTRVGLMTNPVTVEYTIEGSATAGVDYEPLPGRVTIPAGASTATVTLVPKANPANTNNRTATLTLVPRPAYGVGTGDQAGVTIFANPGSLYVSTLRALPGATASTAYGTATLQLASDEKSAFVNVSFSNLSSPEVVGHLAIDGNYVFNLPPGQVNNALWLFTPVGNYSSADLLAALKAGRVTVSIDTAMFPAGELGGGFLRSSGAAVFNPPPAPPALDLSRISPVDAARFLLQATFGATQADITTVIAKGYHAWINEQMALPPSLHRDETMHDFNRNQTNGGVGNRSPVTQAYERPGGPHRQAAWWKIAVEGRDQLRQRVAFALSQILVISDQNGTIAQWQEGAANYYDIFVNGAFGNFRSILEQVTLSPMMGIYLSSLRNAKATYDARGNVITLPDENYAREIMQLFTIGLNELNPDGTLRLDPTGQPIPTYTQETIVHTARVFTGWSFASSTENATANVNLFRGAPANYLAPMMLWPAFHEDSAKTIVGGRVLPASQGGVKDLADTLDALFQHPNTGPFIARQLIQRLVTSNPSPGYIYRVAQAFANNGAGVRGDLGAVVRAILTDYEARSPAVAATATFGKLKEPLLMTTALFRAFGGGSNSGRFNIPNPEGSLAQAALRAPTVFNFFEPNFVLPGSVAEAGLYAPEYQILNDTTALTQPNFYYNYLYTTRSTTDQAQQTVGLNLTDWLASARTPRSLIDTLGLILTGGSLPAAASDRIVSAISALPVSTAGSTNTAADLERVRSAIYLVLTSPHGAVQK
ncbi:MAG: DUF1800 family protein [Verrucomicrobia bacterium]|nr:DUF1800 family protein [Verrucomicrobiota bacterium]